MLEHRKWIILQDCVADKDWWSVLVSLKSVINSTVKCKEPSVQPFDIECGKHPNKAVIIIEGYIEADNGTQNWDNQRKISEMRQGNRSPSLSFGWH